MCLPGDQAARITCHHQHCLCLLLYLLDSQYCTTDMKTLRRKNVFSAVEGTRGVQDSRPRYTTDKQTQLQLSVALCKNSNQIKT